MGTSSQFYDDAQLKLYPHLAQRYYTSGVWIDFIKTFVKVWELPFKQ